MFSYLTGRWLLWLTVRPRWSVFLFFPDFLSTDRGEPPSFVDLFYRLGRTRKRRRQHFSYMELWDFLTKSNWTSEATALTKYGHPVCPYSPEAVRFNVVGALIRCYLEEGKLWSPVFEEKRNKFVASILNTSNLKQKFIQLNLQTRKLSLAELSKRVDYSFIRTALKKMKEAT